MVRSWSLFLYTGSIALAVWIVIRLLLRCSSHTKLQRQRIKLSRTLRALMGRSPLERDLTTLKNISWELDESLAAGLVPTEDRFEKLAHLPKQLSEMSATPIRELRESGGELRPTLKRIRLFAEKSLEIEQISRTKTLAAFSQSVVCLCMIPVFGVAYYEMLPGIQSQSFHWFCICAFALSMCLIALIWIYRMSVSAQFGGLNQDQRGWILFVRCMGERLVARIKQGEPPDLAWDKLIADMPASCHELTLAWGIASGTDQKLQNPSSMENLILRFGIKMKEVLVFMSLQGHPSLERVSGLVDQLNSQMDLIIKKELEQLPLRALKPLFILVCPSVLLVALVGVFFGFWNEGMSEINL
jgi:hypothetical protein